MSRYVWLNGHTNNILKWFCEVTESERRHNNIEKASVKKPQPSTSMTRDMQSLLKLNYNYLEVLLLMDFHPKVLTFASYQR